jgi:hypothetical protein
MPTLAERYQMIASAARGASAARAPGQPRRLFFTPVTQAAIDKFAR